MTPVHRAFISLLRVVPPVALAVVAALFISFHSSRGMDTFWRTRAMMRSKISRHTGAAPVHSLAQIDTHREA